MITQLPIAIELMRLWRAIRWDRESFNSTDIFPWNFLSIEITVGHWSVKNMVCTFLSRSETRSSHTHSPRTIQLFLLVFFPSFELKVAQQQCGTDEFIKFQFYQTLRVCILKRVHYVCALWFDAFISSVLHHLELWCECDFFLTKQMKIIGPFQTHKIYQLILYASMMLVVLMPPLSKVWFFVIFEHLFY